MRIAAAAFVILAATTAAGQITSQKILPRTHVPTPTSTEISVQDIMTREYVIADDSMEGRDTGKRGGLRSATYIAGELRRLGLEPAGDNGTFFQKIPWASRAPDSAAVLSAGSTPLQWRTDYVLIPHVGFALALGGQPFGGSFHSPRGTATIYGGRLGDPIMIDSSAVDGRIVVFAAPAQRGTFAFWQRDNLRRYSSAAAIVVGTLDAGAPAAYLVARDGYLDTTAAAGTRTLTVISMTSAAIERVFGKPIASLHVGDAGTALSGDARFVEHPTEAPAYNVVAIARGTDPALRNSYVAVGAHHDHVGMGPAVDHDSIRSFNSIVRPRGADDPMPRTVTEAQWTSVRALLDSMRRINPPRRDSIFNGADDDGSGTVLALEMAEWFAAKANRPKRSVLFVFHTGEERGLFGSLFFSDHPTVPRDSIITQINMDQMGRGDPVDRPLSGPNALVVIGSRRLSTELGDVAEAANAASGHPLKFDYQFDRDGHPDNAYCRSDHYMYARYGIPVAFFVAAVSYIDYHMVSDEPQYVAYDRMTGIGQYVRDVAARVANLEHRPAVDHPRPDPNAVCKQ